MKDLMDILLVILLYSALRGFFASVVRDDDSRDDYL
jgi:hypothetical protein